MVALSFMINHLLPRFNFKIPLLAFSDSSCVSLNTLESSLYMYTNAYRRVSFGSRDDDFKTLFFQYSLLILSNGRRRLLNSNTYFTVLNRIVFLTGLLKSTVEDSIWKNKITGEDMQCKDQRIFIQPSALINDEKNSFIFYNKGFSYSFTN